MTKDYSYRAHFACLSALFFLGEGVLLLPAKGSDKYTVLAYIIASLIAFLLYFAAVPLANRIFTGRADSNLKKLICCTVITAVAAGSLFSAADCFKAFSDFAATVLLPDTPKLFSVIILSVTVIYLALKPKSVFLKYSLIAFTAAAFVIIFLFVAAMGNYSPKNIYIYSLPDAKTLFTDMRPFFSHMALPALLLPFFEASLLGKSRFSSQTGIYIGFILSGLCLLVPLLTFSPALAGRLDYPFSAAVSTVTLGRLFTRADGLAYVIYFICTAVKTAACIIITIRSLKKIREILA